MAKIYGFKEQKIAEELKHIALSRPTFARQKPQPPPPDDGAAPGGVALVTSDIGAASLTGGTVTTLGLAGVGEGYGIDLKQAGLSLFPNGGVVTTLSTRTDNDTGIIDKGGLNVDGSDYISLFWSTGNRLHMEITADDATTISLNGGTGDNLPADDSEVYAVKDFPIYNTNPAAVVAELIVQYKRDRWGDRWVDVEPCSE